MNPNGPPSKGLRLFQCNLPGASEVLGKLNPNALEETYGYDSRNRLTRRYLGTQATGGTFTISTILWVKKLTEIGRVQVS